MPMLGDVLANAKGGIAGVENRLARNDSRLLIETSNAAGGLVLDIRRT